VRYTGAVTRAACRLLLLLAALAVTTGAGATGSGQIYGVTLDNDAGISHADLAAQTAALAALPRRPVARIVADIGTRPVDFAESLPAVHRVADVVLELGDSSEVKGVAPAAYGAWARALTTRYAPDVDIWEIGNEVNGEWAGTPVEETARIALATSAVRAIGGQTMLTLYYNPGCWEKRGSELFTWLAAGHLPRDLARSLDYVTISYYPGDCNGYWPSAAGWQRVFDRLHARFPRSKLGFGEAGTSSKAPGAAARLELWRRYVAVQIRGDRYVGLGLWWTWAEDAVPATGAFWRGFADSLR
jgi:hypothetical protein